MRFLWAYLLVGVLAGASTARATEVRQESDPLAAPAPALPGLSLWAIQPMSPAGWVPGFGVQGMTGIDARSVTDPLFGSSDLLQPADFSAAYQATVHGSEVGLFGGYNGRSTVFESAPTTGWNVGASLGYAGFYFRAGISDTGGQIANLTTDARQGWLAGLGYQLGGLDLRVTYMAAEGNSLAGADLDNRTWMIGGIYQISPRIRVNADAFTSGHDLRTLGTLPAANAAAPQGNGARVGIQLRF